MNILKYIGIVLMVTILFSTASIGQAARHRSHHHRIVGVDRPNHQRRFRRHLSSRSHVRHRLKRHLFPPHHRLWLCIHSYEAQSWYDPDSGGSGHYGGLQMTYNWGYGIVGYPSHYSQAEQERAAERGFRQGGVAFLYQQWFNWDGAAPACLRYA